MSTALSDLRERLGENADLNHAAAVLHWDQNTMMPAHGAAQRAEALGTLSRIQHEHFIAAETGRLLEVSAGEVQSLPDDSDEARLVRQTRRRWEKARRVPSELAAEMSKAASVGYEAWVAARQANDFSAFAPYLEHNLELTRRYVECFDGYDVAYDVLLDDYDPGMQTQHVKQLFDELKSELVPLIARLRDQDVDVAPLHVSYPIEGQRQLVREVVSQMGFNEAGWRLDDTVHPFATSFGRDDVRITTRFQENYFPMGLYGAMHECGHGLYEAGISPSLQRTPIGGGESLAVHESQSRLWENLVGRSRAYSQVLAPRLAELSGGSLRGLQSDVLFKAVNKVSPSLIRIEADETTYGLHIIIRFELEQELLGGQLSLSELPEAWNARMREYLGIDVPSDADGVLQDVHWSSGLIGYFPTYALGNLIAGQLWEKVQVDIPDLDAQIAAGELGGLRRWLGQQIHQHGSKFDSNELLQRVVGGPIAVAPFVRYLKAKLSDVYGVELA
ncbi:MAG TPA: carboxypeptidase M32 [Solirubrobacteraceae bacterium]|nr:carboxypeptidase M32 [Solirubrobacteraceae bacterium]